MKHTLEKKVLFYGVIVRTFWMTLVLDYLFNIVFSQGIIPDDCSRGILFTYILK